MRMHTAAVLIKRSSILLESYNLLNDDCCNPFAIDFLEISNFSLYCFDLLVPERIVFSGGRSLRSESLDKSGVLYNSTIPQPGIHKNLPFGK